MTAVDLSANGGFAQLARAFVDIQAQEFLPLLPAAGVRDLRGALADTNLGSVFGGPFSVQGPDMGGSYGGLGLAGVADLPGLGEEGPASLRRGRYRSAQNYFDAAVTYQEHFRSESVPPALCQGGRPGPGGLQA